MCKEYSDCTSHMLSNSTVYSHIAVHRKAFKDLQYTQFASIVMYVSVDHCFLLRCHLACSSGGLCWHLYVNKKVTTLPSIKQNISQFSTLHNLSLYWDTISFAYNNYLFCLIYDFRPHRLLNIQSYENVGISLSLYILLIEFTPITN